MKVKPISRQIISEVSGQAQTSSRKRKNYNYHESYADPINRMLNAVEPGSYVQPHKHENPDKREVFILLKGKLAVFFFDDLGNVTKKIILDNNENFGVDIPSKIWHTIVALEPGTVVYEIKDGPYSPEDDKNFAKWAPKEGGESCEEYLRNLFTILADNVK